MKILSTVLIVLTLLTSQTLYAHSDHAHGPISEADARSLALDVATNLTSRDAGLGFGQLPQTWASVPINNIVVLKDGAGYYVVSVLNESDKKTLYILMSKDGEVFDANFTGKFEGVKY